MKKTLIALVALVAIAASAATTVSVEYDYNRVANAPKGTPGIQYGYVGIAQDTKYGTFDIGLQGVNTTDMNTGALARSGWEIGYTYPVTIGKVTVLPRIATGQMNSIAPVEAGLTQHNKYFLASVEGDYRLSEKFGTYVSYSHMNSIQSTPLHANRVQVGIDYAVSKAISVRTGYSYQKFDGDNMNGLVLVGSYSF